MTLIIGIYDLAETYLTKGRGKSKPFELLTASPESFVSGFLS